MPRRFLCLLEACLLVAAMGPGGWDSISAADRQVVLPRGVARSEVGPASNSFAELVRRSHRTPQLPAPPFPQEAAARLPLLPAGRPAHPPPGIEPPPRREVRPAFRNRLPGEFERQCALLLGGREMLSEMPDVFADIVEATRNHVAIITMVNDAEEADLARAVLLRRAVQAELHLVQVAHNTMWSRDYGPVMVDAGGEARIVDADYGQFDRPDDDEVPYALAHRLQIPVVKAPLLLEGGNLLSNGRGLCLATTKVLEDNVDVQDEEAVRGWIEQMYGATETLFLEPLEGESTGHVDMFAAFTAPYVVVVGSCDPQRDAANAALLDRNAERLSQLRIRGRKLRVERIPMPPHDDGIWRTYTNVVFANGVLLVPVYPGHDEQGQLQAIQTYCRLLPGWRIVSVNANRLIECGGALHCVTMNLGPLRKIPIFPAPQPGVLQGPPDFSDAVTEVAGSGQFAPLRPFDPFHGRPRPASHFPLFGTLLQVSIGVGETR